MSPKEAKVVIFEDDPKWREAITERLKKSGHTVVGEASTLTKGLKLVESLKEKGVQVATIDGNLSPNEASGADGQAILRAIKQSAPDVRTVGMAGGHVRGTDVDLGKLDLNKLGGVVTKL